MQWSRPSDRPPIAVGDTLAKGTRARATLAFWTAAKHRRLPAETAQLPVGAGVWVAHVLPDGKAGFLAGTIVSWNNLAGAYVVAWDGDPHYGQIVHPSRVTPRLVGEAAPHGSTPAC